MSDQYMLMATGVKEGPFPFPLFFSHMDVDGRGGMGVFGLTNDTRRAMKFASAQDALNAWRKQSKVRPLREDLRPNRPMTAVSIAIVRDDEVNDNLG